MKNLFLVFFILLLACSKTDKGATTPTPTVVEESIKFTTNLDTGTFNVVDTLPLVISISSKIPAAGVIFSISATLTDSSKQVYKLDSSTSQSSLSLKIPGLKITGNYSISITVTSKSTSSNTNNKSIAVINSPLARFQGYKVDPNAKVINDYWRSLPLPSDLLIYKFQTPPVGVPNLGNSQNVVCGDFNNDGWVDIFAPGMCYAGRINVNTSFLIWNPIKKIFEQKNLINDTTIINIARTDPNKVVPVYLNDDNYVDLVVFGFIDEGLSCDPPNQVILLISDGKGGYNINKITTETPTLAHFGGDVGDLNGDKIPDIVVNEGGLMKIMWGSKSQPYYSESNSATFADPTMYNCNGVQLFFKNDNSFGEVCPECVFVSIYDCKISDINNDGQNDLVLTGPDDINYPSRVILNQGGGKFNKKGIVYLPFTTTNVTQGLYEDYISDDLNGDGLVDLIALHATSSFSVSELVPLIQQKDGTFLIDNSYISMTSSLTVSRERLIYADVNGDGKKDIMFLQLNDGNLLKSKTVLIRTGNKFVEQPFYQFDPYANSLIK